MRQLTYTIVLILAACFCTGQANATDRQPVFSINPEGWYFGAVEVFNTAEREFVISNLGDAPFTIPADGIWVSGEESYDFQVYLPNLPLTIQPGVSYSFTVAFIPYSNWPEFMTALLHIQDGITRVEHTYSLSGTVFGDMECWIQLWPPTVTGNDVTLQWEELCPILRPDGQSRFYQYFQIICDGTVIDTYTPTDPWEWYFQYTHYNVPNGTHYYQVQGDDGLISEVCEVTVNAPPEYFIDPEGCFFGYVPVGVVETVAFTIYNQGGGTIHLTDEDIQITDDLNGVFTLIAPNLPADVTSTQPYTFYVNFAPTVADEFDLLDAQLMIDDNQGGGLHYYYIYGVGTSGYLEFAYVSNASVSDNDVTLTIEVMLPVREANKTHPDRALTGINIWRDDALIAAAPVPWDYYFLYTDHDVPYGQHGYSVQCVFSSGLGEVYGPYNVFVNYVEVSSPPQISLAGNLLLLGWDAVAGAEWYGIYSADNPLGTWNYLGYVPASFTGLTFVPAERKFFRITAGLGAPPRGPVLEGYPGK